MNKSCKMGQKNKKFSILNYKRKHFFSYSTKWHLHCEPLLQRKLHSCLIPWLSENKVIISLWSKLILVREIILLLIVIKFDGVNQYSKTSNSDVHSHRIELESEEKKQFSVGTWIFENEFFSVFCLKCCFISENELWCL